jgi:transcriptional regulator with XRE-family HTH domain
LLNNFHECDIIFTEEVTKMLKLYENIRSLRLEKRMTQDELARRAGYTDRSSIAKIERGVVDLPQSKIKQFADIFGVTPGHLMGWDDSSPEDLGAVAAVVLRDPGLLKLVQNYIALGESDQYALRLMSESLVAKKEG